MWSKPFRFSFLFLLIFSSFSWAQLDQKGRFEVELSNSAQNIHLANMEEMGTLIAFESRRNRDSGDIWEFIRIDTAFNILWKTNLYVDQNFTIVNHEVIGSDVYFILLNLMNWRETMVLQVNQKGEFEAQRFKNLIPMSIDEFKVIDKGKKLLVGGYFNYRPIAVLYEIDSNIPRILPGLLNYIGDLVQLEVSEEFRRIDLLIGYSSNKINRNSLLLSYDFEGNLLESTLLELDEKQTIKHGRVNRLNEEDVIFGGVYGKKSSNYTTGVVVSYIHDGKVQFTHRKGYGRMDNFFDYMKPRRRARVKNRISRKLEKGKEPTFFFRTKINDVDIIQNGIFVSGESYYLQYSDYNRYYFSSHNSFPSRIFDGYEYTHGFIAAFDPEGELLFNHSMGIDNLKKYNLDQVTFSSPDNKDKRLLFYVNKNDLSFGVFSKDSAEFYLEPIQLKYPNDRLRSSHSLTMEIENWYGNNYLVFGKQQIRNGMDRGVDFSRNVFFINKIQYSY